MSDALHKYPFALPPCALHKYPFTVGQLSALFFFFFFFFFFIFFFFLFFLAFSIDIVRLSQGDVAEEHAGPDEQTAEDTLGDDAPTVDTEDSPGAETHPVSPPADAEEDAGAPFAASLPPRSPSNPPPITEHAARTDPSTPPAHAPANSAQEEPARAASMDGDDDFEEWLGSGKHTLSFLRIPMTVQV